MEILEKMRQGNIVTPCIQGNLIGYEYETFVEFFFFARTSLISCLCILLTCYFHFDATFSAEGEGGEASGYSVPTRNRVK